MLTRKYLVGAALLAACGNAPAEDLTILPELKIAAAPSRGLQMIMPIQKNIPAGKEIELCTWTDKVLDQDVDVESVLSAQAGPGHHIVVYTTQVMQPPGTSRECLDIDMVTFRFVVGAGGEGTGYANKPPEGLSFHMAKGSQIVVNEHFLNASPTARDGQSAFNLYYYDPSKSSIRSSLLTFVDTSINVPTGASSLDLNCTMRDDFAAWRVMPHMHAWGKHILIEQEHDGVNKRLFDVDWNPSMVFEPPTINGTVDAPVWFRKGDKVHVRCDWNNTTGGPLPFGKEMCIGVGDIIDFDKRGSISCENNEFSSF